MGTFEEILNKAKRGVEFAGQKTGDFIEITKLKMALSDTEKELADTFEGLGRLVYDSQKSEADVSELIEECVQNIDELQETADTIREQVYAYKNMDRCVACGAIIDRDAAFCCKCGAPLTVDTPEKEAEESAK